MKLPSLIKKYWVRITLIAAAIAIVALVAFRPTTATSETVVTERVKTDNINLLVSASGNIVPKSTYSIVSKVTTKATSVNVKVGDHVKKGDVLVKYDDTDLQNAVKIASYNFNAAIYKREQAKNASIYDQYMVDQAQQQVNVTYTQLQNAKNAVNNATITSPIDGEILVVNIKVEEFGSITTPAVIVADTSNFEAVIPINEIDINKITVGQNANLSIDAIDGIISGAVTSVDNNGVNNLGIVTYQVKIVPSTITGLRPNMSVDADIIVTQKTNVLVVPAAAIQKENGKSYVKVLASETDASTTARKVEVTTGITNSTLTEITSGLSDGEIVIINIINNGSSSIFNFGSSK